MNTTQILDVASSASRQHHIDTGRYLTVDGHDVIDGADTRSPSRIGFLADVLCTAMEGGINYWAGLQRSQRGLPDTTPGWTGDMAPLAWVAATVVDEDGDGPYTVSLSHLDYAFLVIAAGPITGMNERTRATLICCHQTDDMMAESGADIDADLADQVFQVAAFGRVIYG